MARNAGPRGIVPDEEEPQVEETEGAEEEDNRDIWEKAADLLPLIGAIAGGLIVRKVTKKGADAAKKKVASARRKFDKSQNANEIEASGRNLEEAERQAGIHGFFRGVKTAGGTYAGYIGGSTARDMTQKPKRRK